MVLDGDIFSVESPKAFAPLGYGTLAEPVVVRPEDFKNDIPLPSYGKYLIFPFIFRLCLITNQYFDYRKSYAFKSS